MREALKELGSTAESSVYVGDSDVDIETARNSGMDEILCDWGFRGERIFKRTWSEDHNQKARGNS